MISSRLLAAALVLALGGTLAAPTAVATYPVPPPCGVATDPACWAQRFGCQMYGPYVTGTPLEDCENFTSGAEVALHQAGVLGVPTVLPDVLGFEDDHTCENFGIIIMVTGLGTNRYCVDGECENSGIIVMVGHSESCYGEGFGTVCVAERCIVGPHGLEGVGTLERHALA